MAALGEVTGRAALTTMYDRMMRDPTGQRILRDRPYVDGSIVDLEVMSSSVVRHPRPGGGEGEGEGEGSGAGGGRCRPTFGNAYASYMKTHGFHPDDRDGIRYLSDPDLAYVMLRYRQVRLFFLFF